MRERLSGRIAADASTNRPCARAYSQRTLEFASRPAHRDVEGFAPPAAANGPQPDPPHPASEPAIPTPIRRAALTFPGLWLERSIPWLEVRWDSARRTARAGFLSDVRRLIPVTRPRLARVATLWQHNAPQELQTREPAETREPLW